MAYGHLERLLISQGRRPELSATPCPRPLSDMVVNFRAAVLVKVHPALTRSTNQIILLIKKLNLYLDDLPIIFRFSLESSDIVSFIVIYPAPFIMPAHHVEENYIIQLPLYILEAQRICAKAIKSHDLARCQGSHNSQSEKNPG
jgi:hypothetical protein